ncbi:hypothetical protein EVA_06570, partial [gut metagenome]
ILSRKKSFKTKVEVFSDNAEDSRH